MCKSIFGTLPLSFQYIFVLKKNIHKYSTRYSDNVYINSCATQVIAYSICSYRRKIWNEFPSRIYDSRHLFIFLKSNSNCFDLSHT